MVSIVSRLLFVVTGLICRHLMVAPGLFQFSLARRSGTARCSEPCFSVGQQWVWGVELVGVVDFPVHFFRGAAIWKDRRKGQYLWLLCTSKAGQQGGTGPSSITFGHTCSWDVVGTFVFDLCSDEMR